MTNAPSHDTDQELQERWAQLSAGNEPFQNWSKDAGELLTRIGEASTGDRITDQELLNLITRLESTDSKLNEIFVASTKGAGK